MQETMQIGATILNMVLLFGGIAGFVFFIVVLIKFNKALNIWLADNKRQR